MSCRDLLEVLSLDEGDFVVTHAHEEKDRRSQMDVTELTSIEFHSR